MLRSGDIALFRTEIRPDDDQYREFFLKFLERDENGLIMAGDIPHLWNNGESMPTGPAISGERIKYIVQKINYDRRLVWLAKLN